MMPVEREFVRPDFVTLGTKLACAEMIRSGTTCFADMYYFEEAVAQATADAGLRALCGQTVLKFPAPDAASFEDALERARAFIERWKGHPLVVPAVAPHAPYTCTDRDPQVVRGARVRVRRAASHPPRRNLVRSGAVTTRARHAGRAVGPQEPAVRCPRAGGALCARGRRGDPDAAGCRRRHRAQPHEQPQAGIGRGAGGEDAGDRRARRHRHRRHRVEQRPRHVRGNAPGGAARQGGERRSHGPAGAAGARDGDLHRRARRPPWRHHRLARTRQARGSHRGRSRSGPPRAALQPRSRRHLRAARLCRQGLRRRAISCATDDG